MGRAAVIKMMTPIIQMMVGRELVVMVVLVLAVMVVKMMVVTMVASGGVGSWQRGARAARHFGDQRPQHGAV